MTIEPTPKSVESAKIAASYLQRDLSNVTNRKQIIEAAFAIEESEIQDAITNLLHLAFWSTTDDGEGVCVESLVEHAQAHFYAEQPPL